MTLIIDFCPWLCNLDRIQWSQLISLHSVSTGQLHQNWRFHSYMTHSDVWQGSHSLSVPPQVALSMGWLGLPDSVEAGFSVWASQEKQAKAVSLSYGLASEVTKYHSLQSHRSTHIPEKTDPPVVDRGLLLHQKKSTLNKKHYSSHFGERQPAIKMNYN